jgi:hypothetical protein
VTGAWASRREWSVASQTRRRAFSSHEWPSRGRQRRGVHSPNRGIRCADQPDNVMICHRALTKIWGGGVDKRWRFSIPKKGFSQYFPCWAFADGTERFFPGTAAQLSANARYFRTGLDVYQHTGNFTIYPAMQVRRSGNLAGGDHVLAHRRVVGYGGRRELQHGCGRRHGHCVAVAVLPRGVLGEEHGGRVPEAGVRARGDRLREEALLAR